MMSPLSRCGALAALLLFAAGATQADVTVRGGRHPNFNRLVFDYQAPVDYTLRLDDGSLVITLQADEPLDFDGVDPETLPLLGTPDARIADGQTEVRVPVPDTAATIDFVLGTRVVIDVFPEEAEARQAERGRAARLAGTASPDTPETAGAPVDASEDLPDLPSSRGGVPDGRAGVAGSVPPSEADTARQAPDRPRLGTVAVTAESIPGGVALTLPFEGDLPAANVFERAGRAWIVFSNLYDFDLSGLDFRRPPLDGRLTGARRVDTEQTSGLVLDLAVDQSLVAKRERGGWRVEFKDGLATPARPLRVVPQPGEAGTQIFLPVESAWRPVRVNDDAVGDELVLVPVSAPGIGLADTRRYAEFVLIATAQGIAVQPLADGLAVQRFNNGVQIFSRDGLALTDTARADGRLRPRRLIDLRAWALGGRGDFVRNRTQLIAAISDLPDSRRNSGRWELARFYVAHDEAAEALGILELMLDEDEGLIDTAEFRAVRGLANLMQRRTGQALEDLRHPELLVDPDASLWRTLAAEPEGRTQEALDAYLLGKDIIGFYRAERQAAFRLAAIKAALAEERYELAEDELAEFESLDLTQGQRGQALLLRARLAAARGEIVAALDLFEQAAQTPDPGAAALARLERIRFALKHENLTPTLAVEQLEDLRFAWRGQDFEIDLLSTLGELYISIGRYRQGFNTLRQAVEVYPDDPRTGRIVRQMQRYFELLFLEGGGDLTPFEAVALFEDFRELTPQGATGDRIIRRLVDRLVAVDLLDRAADLLRYQVEFRLEGAPQAQIAARLAKVHLLNREPKKALDILRATRQARVPEDIRRERKLVEARALTEMESYEEAEVLLEGEIGPEVERLRADIFWEADNWPAVVRSAETLLGDPDGRRALSIEDRQQVVRWAIALTFLEEDRAILALRENWGGLMRDGEFERVFDLFTQQEIVRSQSPAERARSIANVNAFRSFLANYRADFTEDPAADDAQAPAPEETAAAGAETGP